MSSESFHFKQFSVCHSGSAMKVGTDGVLLGVLSECEGCRLLDIGTGSGVVALILAQRNLKAEIVGVEIERQAALQAQQNFINSPWSARLSSICADVTTFDTTIRFDAIVCNPPYYEHSPQSSDVSRNCARNTELLSRETLVKSVVRLLGDEGFFSVILPQMAMEDFILFCWQNNLYLQRRILICTKNGKPCKRVVLVFSKKHVSCAEQILPLLAPDGSRSVEYQQLVNDFLIK